MYTYYKYIFLAAITLTGLQGCSSNLGVEYPDLYEVKKISSDALTKEQAAERIRNMQNEAKSHGQNAEKQIKSDI